MRYSVLVKPNSKKGPLVVADPTTSELTVFLREKPVDGAANAGLIRILSEYFHVAKTRVRIQNGSHSRHKIVEIS